MSADLNKPVSEAPESNAGDDFHRIWAAKKALDLINFEDDGLKLVSIEGSQFDEAKDIDETGRKLLSIDMAEYYGGMEFKAAKKVIFTQLKYSTRNPDMPYTVARLCEGKGDNKDRSIIERLAETFNAYRDQFGRDEVVSKLTSKLVTNRPVTPAIEESLKEIQDYLSKKPGPVNYKQLLADFDDDSDMLTRLYKASSLASQAFTDFLRVLDFSDCGTDNRAFQRSKLITQLSGLDPQAFKIKFNALYVLINDMTMPERREKNSLDIDDIVLLFEMGRIENLFPAPSRFEQINAAVLREQVPVLLATLVGSARPVICLHGEGGTGKSTIIRQLIARLPAGSAAISYDCYGQGTYRNTEAPRHLPQVAFMEVINELAKENGTGFLISPGGQDYLLTRTLSERLHATAALLRSANKDAIMAIFIDAADNSVTAAGLRHETCFVPELVGMGGLPDNCRLVFTCRSSRMKSLQLPEECLYIPLLPFSLAETKQFLGGKIGALSDDEVAEFHQLTGGIPRVQSYSILHKKDIGGVLRFLKPYGHSVGTLIKEHLRQAKLKTGDSKTGDSLLKAMIRLPRPVPVKYIALLADVPAAEVLDFARDLWTGLVADEDTIAFRDEDFEHALEEDYPADMAYNARVSDLFMEHADTDTYAAIHLGTSLYTAGRYDLLKEIVLENKYLAISDPLQKRDIFVGRTRLAIRSCGVGEDNSTFIKLLVTAAEAAKSNAAQLDLIYNNVGLVVENQNLHTIQKLYYNLTDRVEYGAANWQVAAIFSRSGVSAPFAEKHLMQAEKWTERRREKAEEDLRDWPISKEDLASGAEAIFRLYGTNAAASWLKRWRPKGMMPSVIQNLLQRLVLTLPATIQQEAAAQIIRLDVQVLISFVLAKNNRPPVYDPKALFKGLGKLLSRAFRFPEVMNEPLLFLCEKYCHDTELRDTCLAVLKTLRLSRPIHNTRFIATAYTGKDEVAALDQFFRVETLIRRIDGQKLNVEDLLPPGSADAEEAQNRQQQTQLQRQRERTKTELWRLYERLLPLYKLKATVILRDVPSPKSKVEEAFKTFTDDYVFLHERGYDSIDLVGFAGRVLASCAYFTVESLKLFEALRPFATHYKINKHNFLLNLTKLAANFETCHQLVYQLLSELDAALSDGTSMGSERISFYQDCIHLTQKMNDPDEAIIYFEKAMEAAADVDLEAQEQIRAIHSLSVRLPADNADPELAYEMARFTEQSAIVLSGYDHFPWTAALQTIAAIDLRSLPATWCRWDDQDLGVDSDAHYLFWSELIAKYFTEKGISFEQAAGLTAFHPLDYYWDKLWKMLLERCRAQQYRQLDQLNTMFVADINAAEAGSWKTYALKLRDIFGEVDVPLSLFPAALERFIEPAVADVLEEDNRHTPVTAPGAVLAELVQKTEPGSTESIRAALTLLQEQGPQHAEFSAAMFLSALRDACPPALYTAQLDALLELEDRHISYAGYRDALAERIQAWRSKQTVKQWQNKNFDRVIANHLLFFKDRFRGNDYLDVYGLGQLKQLFGKSDTDLGNALKKLFPEIIDDLPAKVIYQSFNIFNMLLSPNDTKVTLTWIIGRWTANIPDTIAEGPWQEALRPSPVTTENIAGFLRYHLGHPDTSKRWQALHVFERCAEFQDNNLLKLVFSRIDDPGCHPFQHDRHVFFSVSAKVWLYTGLDHLAGRAPALVLPLLEDIKKELFHIGEQHLLVRMRALSICGKLQEYAPALFSNGDIKLLAEWQALPLKEPAGDKDVEDESETGEWEAESQTRFPFDRMDTGPDYYEPMAQIFGVPAALVYQLAEQAIFKNMHCTVDPVKDDHVRKRNSRLTDRGSSFPSEETVTDYYEFNGLFYAADRLFQQYSEKDKGYYTWEEWIRQWDTSWKGFWLCDLLDVRPADLAAPDNISAYSPNWQWLINAEKLDMNSGLMNFNKIEFVTVDLHENSAVEHGSETAQVNSALVNTDKARALLNALQTAENPYRYKLPIHGEDYEVTKPREFSLRPMVASYDAPTSGIDLLDPMSKSLARLKKTPSTDFMDWARATAGADGRYTFADADPAQMVSIFENWCKYDNNYKHHKQGSNGTRLRITKAKLLDYLTGVNNCLLIESQLSRETDSRSYEEDRDWTRPMINVYTKLYLIYPDGRIITIHGDFEPWKKDC